MKVEDAKKTFDYLISETNKVVVGQHEMLKQVLVALLADSHALLEGYPGVAKTLTIKTISQLLDLKFSRIQNTPDLMPSDITGTYIIEDAAGKRSFKFQPGPVFANVDGRDGCPRGAAAALVGAHRHRPGYDRLSALPRCCRGQKARSQNAPSR